MGFLLKAVILLVIFRPEGLLLEVTLLDCGASEVTSGLAGLRLECAESV